MLKKALFGVALGSPEGRAPRPGVGKGSKYRLALAALTITHLAYFVAPAFCLPLAANEYNYRVETNFDLSTLPPIVQEWHAKMVSSVLSSRPLYFERCGSNDSYFLSRFVAERSLALFNALLATGDQFFLDEVANCWDIAREDLSDDWCGAPDDSPGIVDRGWVYKGDGDTGSSNYCKDNHNMEEAMLHGWIGFMAYVFDKNREITAPDGETYGEKADFYLDYLLNDFLPKWTRRVGGNDIATWNSFSGAYKRLTHPRSRQALTAQTLFMLTGDSFFQDRLNDIEVDFSRIMNYVPTSDAYKWPHEVRDANGNPIMPGTTGPSGWQRMNYSEYTLNSLLILHTLGEGRWSLQAEMQKLTRTLRDVVFQKYGPNSDVMAYRNDGSEDTSFDLGSVVGFARFDESGWMIQRASSVYEGLSQSSQNIGTGMQIAGGVLFALSERSEVSSNPTPTPT
ncbi:MAG: hypothetical protein KDD42_09920, partial [Bdellovibrionales bacterium]|nr:hypothetical protein [Bdellovibrionales bacterium]